MNIHMNEREALRRDLVARLRRFSLADMPATVCGALQPFGSRLYTYCAFSRERLAQVTLPCPIIGIVLGGTKEVWFGDVEHHLRAGDAFVLPGGIEIDVVNVPAPDRLYESLILQVPSLPAGLCLPAVEPARRVGAKGIALPLTPALVSALAHAAEALDLGGDAAALAEHRLAEVLMLVSGMPAAAPLFCVRLTDRVRWLVFGAPDREWTAASLGRELGIGASTLRRRLAAEGQAVRPLLRQTRLRVARLLIAQGRSVTEATQAAGYASRSHFARHFRAEYGAVPRDVARAGT